MVAPPGGAPDACGPGGPINQLGFDFVQGLMREMAAMKQQIARLEESQVGNRLQALEQ